MAASATDIEDDDFGDFGGFEAAEPVEATVAECGPPSVQTAVTSWAVMAAAAPSPGSLQTENVPAHSAHGAETQQSSNSNPTQALSEASLMSNPEDNSRSQAVDNHSAATNWAAMGEDVDSKALFKADFENLNTAATSELQTVWPSANDKETATTSSLERSEVSRENNTPEPYDLDLDMDLGGTLCASSEVNTGSKRTNAPEKKIKESLTDDTNTAQVQLTEVQNEYQLLKDKNLLLQKEIEELRTGSKFQTDQLSDVQDRLEQQKKKYTDLQEMCKVSVLEQQEECQKILVEALAAQTERYEDTLNKQKEDFQRQLEEIQRLAEEKTEKSLRAQREEAKLEIQQTLLKEGEKNQQVIQQALQESHIKHKKQMEEALEAERVTSKQALNESKETWEKSIDNIREDSLHLVKKTLEEERDRCTTRVREALKTEAQSQKEAMSEILKQAKYDVQQYIQEYKQSDARVRHRSLASIDLFLEGARQQVQLLLNPEQNSAENKKPNVKPAENNT